MYDSYFITCLENQSIFQITDICTEHDQGVLTFGVASINYAAGHCKRVTGETAAEEQLVWQVNRRLMYI